MAALAGEASLPDRDPKLHAACDECSKSKVLKYIICDNYLRVPPAKCCRILIIYLHFNRETKAQMFGRPIRVYPLSEAIYTMSLFSSKTDGAA